jgi:hypothetical protein
MRTRVMWSMTALAGLALTSSRADLAQAQTRAPGGVAGRQASTVSLPGVLESVIWSQS